MSDATNDSVNNLPSEEHVNPTNDASVSDTLSKDAHEASNVTSSKGRSHRKRTHASMNEDSPFSEMTEQLKQITVAVTALSHGPVNTNEFHKIVMNVEGFEEDMLDETFDHLVNDEKTGRAFMAKNLVLSPLARARKRESMVGDVSNAL
ncbi:hypothetical protein CFP56_000260 [Quercus suber]|uniref:Uncharacterized protein n=1 Tax=Quercus suber TaxID=58331 RepID=A0AAW0MD15_QUESU